MRLGLATLAGAAALSCHAPAAARTLKLDPTFDIRQIASYSDADDETLTYSEVAVGLNGTVDTRRIKASLTYQYGRKFVESGDANRDDRHSLFARADIDVIDNRLSIDAGAFAALLNRDFRGQVSYSPDQDSPNLVQTYSAYIEPHYHQPIPSVGDLDLTYRVGYYDVSENARSVGGVGGLPGNSSTDTPFDAVSDSVNQTVEARLGNRENRGRFRWDVIGSLTTEDVSRLDQRYRAYNGKVELEYVVRRGIGLIGNVGYEHVRNNEAAVLRDATGLPVLDANNDYQVDPAAPRNSIYSRQGLTYEGGIRLQPTRRTYLNFRAGKQFGRLSLNGDARYEVTPRLVFSARLTEGIDSFGRLLTRDLNGTTVRSVVSNAAVIGLGGCVFGIDPGSGSCLFNATQSITNATFRNRAVQALAEFRHGRSGATLAVIYSDRKFLDSQTLQAPTTAATTPDITDGSDRSLSVDARFSQELRGRQRFSLGVFANRYEFALSQGRADYYVGTTGEYSASIGRWLSAQVTLTAAKRYSDAAPDTFNATASAGLRFQF